MSPEKAMINRQRLAALRLCEDQKFAHRTIRSQSLQMKAMAHLPPGVPMSWMCGLYWAPLYNIDKRQVFDRS
jgi:hypothetical protein